MALRPALLALLLIAASTPAAAEASCDQGGTRRRPWPDCPGHIGGSEAAADRIPVLHLGATPEYAGYRSHKSICASVGEWQVSSHQSQGPLLPPYHYFYAWSVYGKGALVCSRLFEVPGHSTGPADSAGESLRCPEHWPGYRSPQSTPVDVGWWVSEQRPYVQVHGSFGHNRDGFWHYRIHNPGAGSVTVQLYGFCEP